MLKAGSKNTDLHLVILFISLVTPLVLYINRHVDDNRLTSWQWAFGNISPAYFFMIIVFALLLAWGVSRLSFKGYRSFFLFVFSFLSASLFWDVPEVIVDASRYFTQAKQLKMYGLGYYADEWSKEIFSWTDLPFIPFLYGLIFKFFGEQRTFIQIVNTLFFSGTVILTYQLGKILWHDDVGFYGALLLLGIPYLFTQIPLMLVDVPTMFFLMLAMVSVVRALQKGGSLWMTLAGVSLFFVFYAKYSTWLLLSVMPIIFIYYFFKAPLQTTQRGTTVALLALFLIGVLFYFYKDVMLAQIDFLVSYQKPGLKRWGESYISTFLFQVHPFITAGAIFSVLVAIRKKDWRYLIISYLVLLLVIMQVKRIRYTLPVFPLLALMASYGLQEIQKRRLVSHLVFSIVATSLVVGLVGFLPFLKTLGVQNLQAAGKHLNTINVENIEVFVIAGERPVLNPAISVPLLDIYTDKQLIFEHQEVSPEVLERAKISPLRFTWEFPLPKYYKKSAGSEKEAGALIIVADRLDRIYPKILQERTDQYPGSIIFQQTANIFKYQTFVTVYHK